jgi:hypothetical protein
VRYTQTKTLADFLLQESCGFRTGLSRGFSRIMLTELLRSFHIIPNFLNKSKRAITRIQRKKTTKSRMTLFYLSIEPELEFLNV